ncbi:Putative fluoride ion transporter CrcB [Plasmopara halstedii]|uniref:Putative fluoride ion transporter CrcB n=1 Tax=Plasmopara halstedii TaxID=4781 RepID=A0A0P1A7Z5_PLAHL|nr:Putative fluoride ion transporter CrcB [Plasmopara halstedii]CEG36743.1 Putative fluoride ion transporter CrcB [Plasmopara halstedii]|eukprot:XP_024573112.1 Putative fluoride ion transporter CrcB [Plasmopara halstedii]
MLRAQGHRDDSAGNVDVKDAAIDIAINTEKEQEKVLLRQTETDQAFLWMLLLATVSECVTTCFVPVYTSQFYGLNVSGTVLNWLGPFLDGWTYGSHDRSDVSLACVQFRVAFLGVFTSFSFMVDHAGDLSSTNLIAGPIYVCLSIIGGCSFFCFGKYFAQFKWSFQVSKMRVKRMKMKVSLVTMLLAFVGMTIVRAAFGSHGFVRDPNDPQFIGKVQVADGEELILGILMSCTAVLFSNYICAFFPEEPLELRTATSQRNGPFIDWGCLCCNFLASILAGVTYQLNRITFTDVTGKLLALKFVTSFCGSLSVFSGAVSIITRLWLADNRHSAIWNLLLQLLVGLLVMPYLFKHEVI